MEDPSLSALLLDAPQLMGVESIELDTVNLRMVARTLPGKQFEVGRQIRVSRCPRPAPRRHRRRRPTARSRWSGPSSTRRPQAAPRKRPRGRRSRRHDRLAEGQVRPHAGLDDCAHRRVRRPVLGARGKSTRALRPRRRPRLRSSRRASCPDPNYTWVPRTNVRRPKEPDHHDDHHDQPDGHHDDESHRHRRKPPRRRPWWIPTVSGRSRRRRRRLSRRLR